MTSPGAGAMQDPCLCSQAASGDLVPCRALQVRCGVQPTGGAVHFHKTTGTVWFLQRMSEGPVQERIMRVWDHNLRHVKWDVPNCITLAL